MAEAVPLSKTDFSAPLKPRSISKSNGGQRNGNRKGKGDSRTTKRQIQRQQQIPFRG
jgi:hypothetical protein